MSNARRVAGSAVRVRIISGGPCRFAPQLLTGGYIRDHIRATEVFQGDTRSLDDSSSESLSQDSNNNQSSHTPYVSRGA